MENPFESKFHNSVEAKEQEQYCLRIHERKLFLTDFLSQLCFSHFAKEQSQKLFRPMFNWILDRRTSLVYQLKIHNRHGQREGGEKDENPTTRNYLTDISEHKHDWLLRYH